MVTSFRTFYIQVTSTRGDTLLMLLFEPELGAEAVSPAGRQPGGHAQLDQSHIRGHRGSERSWTPSQHCRTLSTLARTHTRGTSHIQLEPSDSADIGAITPMALITIIRRPSQLQVLALPRLLYSGRGAGIFTDVKVSTHLLVTFATFWPTLCLAWQQFRSF